VKLSPEAIVAVASISVKAVKQATSTIPVVFVGIPEPVAQGFVASLAHPGGNLTGFTNLEATFADKWLGLLKEIAPGVTRAALMFNPDTAANLAGFVRGIPEVQALHTTNGRWDIVVELGVDSLEAFDQALQRIHGCEDRLLHQMVAWDESRIDGAHCRPALSTLLRESIAPFRRPIV